MKIVAHYLKSPFLSLTETWIYRQIINLKRYEPIVYCHGVFNRESFPIKRLRNVHVTNCPFPKRILGKINRHLWKWNLARAMNKDRPTIVHAHYGPSGYAFLPLKRTFCVPMVTTFYGYDVNMLPTQEPIWRERYYDLFKEGDLFLAEGGHMKKCLLEWGCNTNKVIIQHLGVDVEKIRFQPRILDKDEELRVLISGSFREKKGIPYAIEAIGLFRAKQPKTKIKVTLIGDAGAQQREKTEKTRIVDAIRKHGLEQHTNCIGYQPHQVFLEQLLKHHIFLSPSVTAHDGDTEGGAPVSIIEACASGMPVLSTHHCDIPEAVIDGESGLLVPERDTVALAEKLEYLATHDREWPTIGLRGRIHVEENYSTKMQNDKLESIYDRLTSINRTNGDTI